ncbi:MAG TPA: hypothetical protein VHY91_06635 [Pirellulales bacterium]|jgi:hypothetical protein|nr:hypothetical protein [Pirellulales bacterium]
MSAKIPGILAGVAGEYFVAAELSRRGYIASISLRNSRGIDILATKHDATKSVTIQCKANQLGRKEWMLSDKSETFVADNHFYMFVSLGKSDERPHFHIVPSERVARDIKTSHERWLAAAGRGGHKRVDSSIRKFADEADEFLEKWELLRL